MVSNRWRAATVLSLTTAAVGLLAPPATAQYFGGNKVQYKSFVFQVLKTEHFDVYYYDEERDAVEQAARMAERWYERLSRVLRHDLDGRQPLILYASHPDFEQTNAIPGELGEGTGGVTEFLKRRIVLPLAGPLSETDHVIGHELVHAFQFDITGQRRTAAGFVEPAAARLPLWFIEGMAEYLSVGPADPHTAMWMRDAAQINKIPSIKKLYDPRFFPYRYGQALWAYIAGRWGDQTVARILKAAGRTKDPEQAIERELGMGVDSLSAAWHAAIREWNGAAAAGTEPPTAFGRELIVGKKGIGRINVAPALSPDGERLMFLSERNLFSIEMFLADATTGRVLKKITRSAVDPHFQSLQFIQSAGAWSPDGERFAFAAVSRGRPVLSILEVKSGRTQVEVPFSELGEIFNPSWSPDGRRLVFSAIAGGVTDLFVLDLETRGLRRLTDDLFADVHPAWSPDGSKIAFVTDRFSTRLDSLVFGNERLALLDPETGAVEELAGFPEAKNINPQWSADGQSLFFVSDHGGVSNLFRVTLATGHVARITRLATGTSGITRLSPAVSSARVAERVVFSGYVGGDYNLYAIDAPEVLAGKTEPGATNPGGGVPVGGAVGDGAAGDRPAEDSAVGAGTPTVDPALLPPAERSDAELVRLARRPTLGLARPASFTREAYRARLSLDYVSQPSLGIAAGTSGLAVGGGTTLYWSDMLGNHNLATLLQVNNAGAGFANNLAAIVAYENRRSRWNWGLAAGQLPYLTRQLVIEDGTLNGEPVTSEQDFRFWQIDRQVQMTLAYPFSRAQRVEWAAGYRNIDFVSEVEERIFSNVTGELLFDQTTALPGDTIPSLNMVTGTAALVYDTSIFGGTSPVLGQRYRVEFAPVAGDIQYLGVLGDFRRYVMLLRPLGIAGRVLHFGRFGRDAEDRRLSEVFLGNSWLMRGYDSESFTIDECDPDFRATGRCQSFDRLLGSRIAVANLELRLPLFGALGVIRSPAVPPVEVAAFYDAGVAWTKNDKASFLGGARDPVTSYGGAVRLNLLGFAVAEFDLVHPNDRPGRGWYWQFALQPGF